MNADFEIVGQNAAAAFTLKLHRGDGMLLLGMDWKNGQPPADFVGFAIEYREPAGDRFYPLTNRLSFPEVDQRKDPNARSSLRSPIQKFRWVHFPYRADLPGAFHYRVTPVFMSGTGVLTYGEPQDADIVLARETYPTLNVAFTRGFVSSQAFVDRWAVNGSVSTLVPTTASKGLEFTPTHPDATHALDWMGFEARQVILELLDEAIADPDAQVRVVAYDLNEPEVVDRLVQLKTRVMVIVDDSGSHRAATSAESKAAAILAQSTGGQVKRQHMGSLQHNKTIAVSGPRLNRALCGSTNLSWRGFFIQNNNAVIVTGKTAIKPFVDAFDAYWRSDAVADFGASPSAGWRGLGLRGIDADAAFSPHSDDNALLESIAKDIAEGTTSSLFYSLAFLYETEGPILEAIKKVTADENIFVYGMSDRKVGGLVVQRPDGNPAPVSPSALEEDVPEPFKSEPVGGSGTRMHHKFVVIDFDLPTARVYLGSYNFSDPADRRNGENLLLIRDRRIAVSYAVEAVRIFDHYEYRGLSRPRRGQRRLELRKPPGPDETAWWNEDYTNPLKARDRVLFS
jgi:phosphatidylserine/phosphatidylglycerophosphate/cardiolipin synthase-like enzyme